MGLNIITSVEPKRGCGYRKEGGFYLVSPPGDFAPCGRLPFPLQRCPCCGEGFSFSRGWTWIDPVQMFETSECKSLGSCRGCLCDPESLKRHGHVRHGLLWVGEKFYPSPESFIAEAVDLGVSRRVRSIPRGFVVGETIVYLAHIRATARLADPIGEGRPAIFRAWIPRGIDYIVKGDEELEELENLEKRGVRLVKVVRDIDVKKGSTLEVWA